MPAFERWINFGISRSRSALTNWQRYWHRLSAVKVVRART